MSLPAVIDWQGFLLDTGSPTPSPQAGADSLRPRSGACHRSTICRGWTLFVAKLLRDDVEIAFNAAVLGRSGLG
jgi:hypothetical protein